jgi:hypothetical protein
MRKLIQHLWFVSQVRLENIYWVVMPFRKQILLGFQLQPNGITKLQASDSRNHGKGFLYPRSGRPGPVLVDITKMHNLIRFEFQL